MDMTSPPENNLMCFFKSLIFKNGCLPHGIFPPKLCPFICIYWLPCVENDFGQLLHGNVFSTACILLCSVKPFFLTKDLKHCRQENDINSHQNDA